MAAPVRAEAWGIEEVIQPEARKEAKEFECSVCLGIWRDTVQTAECHHIFCKGCVAQLKSCPACRSNIEPKNLQPLQKACQHFVRVLNKLPVSCPFHKQGGNLPTPDHSPTEDADKPPMNRPRVRPGALNGECTWTGSYSDLAPHLDLCEWNIIACPHGCGKELQRRRVDEHARECAKNWTVCELCGEKVRPWLLEAHGKDEAFRHFEVLQKKVEKMQNEANKVSRLVKQVANLAETHVQEELIVTIPNVKAFYSKLSPNASQTTAKFQLAGKGDYGIIAWKISRETVPPVFWTQLNAPPGVSLRV